MEIGLLDICCHLLLTPHHLLTTLPQFLCPSFPEQLQQHQREYKHTHSWQIITTVVLGNFSCPHSHPHLIVHNRNQMNSNYFIEGTKRRAPSSRVVEKLFALFFFPPPPSDTRPFSTEHQSFSVVVTVVVVLVVHRRHSTSGTIILMTTFTPIVTGPLCVLLSAKGRQPSVAEEAVCVQQSDDDGEIFFLATTCAPLSNIRSIKFIPIL